MVRVWPIFVSLRSILNPNSHKMKRTIFVLLGICFLVPTSLVAQSGQKIPLDHSVYDSWKDLSNSIISDDGKWVSYEINPQKGDGWLYLKNVVSGDLDSLPRGFNARFTSNSDFLVFKIKPQFLVTRQARKDKKKGDDMPKDSLGIWSLKNYEISRIEKVKSYQLAEENSSWIVYLHEKILPEEPEEKKEEEELTAEEKEEIKKKKEEIKKLKKAKGTDLVIHNPLSDEKFTFSNVTDYSYSPEGDLITFLEVTGDSITNCRVFVFNTASGESTEVWEKEGEVKQLTTDREGKQLAFVHSGDTIDDKVYSLYGWKEKQASAMLFADEDTPGMPEGWSPNEDENLWFSDDGTKLFLGTAPSPVPEEEDSLLDDEKFKVDVWNWKDPYLQPMQLVNAEREKKRGYLAVIHLDKGNRFVQLATKEVPDIRTILKGNGNIALGVSNLPYRQLISWEANRYQDIFLVNIETGENKQVLKKSSSSVSLSPNGKFVIWWERADSSWYARSVATNQVVHLTRKITVNLYDELNDRPMDPGPYGIRGWLDSDKYVLIADKYDFWKIDPSGKENPVNLTNGYGRKNNIEFNYVRLDREAETINPKELMLLQGFHEFTKQSGFFTLKPDKPADPKKIFMDEFSFRIVAKAKNEDHLIFTKQDFQIYPDLWLGDLNFTHPSKISNTNPQQINYLWGTTELVEWVSFNHDKLQGILYKPENFDPNKKYPMIVYFYERSSDGIHRHSTPRPSRSSINRSYYVSNGYLVFVPDIPYIIGYPGESAYNAIVSGTMALIDRYDFVDKDNIGLNGHSWGGYQIAYLVTRTNMFKCVHSGAPVSNMTSAYGGIRWASGMSRMFQYEQTQSRIGGTLWEKPVHYIQNSPIFFAPKIETPVLMLHNDEDGAVPWYQGIEFFVALRRLGKPVWMLNYNGEGHGIGKRPNAVDFTIRVAQYYDHYLKGKPAPEWLEIGIPAVEKGKKDGYNLIEK